MSVSTQNSTKILSGSIAQRPSAGSVAEINTIFKATDTGDCFILLLVAGVKTWVPLVGGSAAAGWPNYVVSSLPDVPALYSTVGAAIAAAVANGHDANNPVKIILYGYQFHENVTIPDGFSIVSFAEDGPGQSAQIVGDVTYSGSAYAALVGVAVFGQIILSSSGGTFYMSDVTTQPQAPNTDGVSLQPQVGASSNVLAEECFLSSSGTAAGMAYAGPGEVNVTAFNCQFFSPGTFIGGPGTRPSLVLGGSSASSFITDCTLTGQIDVLGTNVTSSGNRILSQVAPYNVAAGAFLTIFGDQTSGAYSKLITGSGSVRVQGIDSLSDVVVVDTTLNTTAQISRTRTYTRQTLTGAGPYAILPGRDEVFISFPNADTTATLPAVQSLLDSTHVLVKTDGTKVITLLPATGDTIDGAPAIALRVVLEAPFPAVLLSVDRASRSWKIISEVDTIGPWDMFVDTVNGNDANPGTAAMPVKTFNGLMAQWPETYKGHFRMYDATTGGASKVEVQPVSLAGTDVVSPPQLVGTGEPPVFIGAPWIEASNFGPLVITSLSITVLPGIGNSTVIHFAGAPFVAHALQNKGWFVQVVAGDPNDIGNESPIIDNTTNSITLLGDWFGLYFQPGDTVKVQVPATSVDFQATSPSGLFGLGPAAGQDIVNGHLLFVGVKTTAKATVNGGDGGTCASLLSTGGEAQLGFCACDIELWDGAAATKGTLSAMDSGFIVFNVLPGLPSGAVDQSAIPVGVPCSTTLQPGNVFGYCIVRNLQNTAGLNLFSNGNVSIESCLFQARITATSGQVQFQSGIVNNAGNTGAAPMLDLDTTAGADATLINDEGGPVAGIFQNVAVSAPGATCMQVSGARCVILNMDLSGADGLIVDDASSMTITGLTGTETNAQGVTAKRGSLVHVTDANVGTVIAGSGGAGVAVKVGANTADSWANIAGGTAVHCTDVNAGSSGVANSQMVRVGP